MNKYTKIACVILLMVSLAIISGCTETPVSQTDQSQWATYVDKSDGMKISYPSNWELIIDKTTPIKTDVPYITMENIVHIYSPDKHGVIQIMGFSYPEDLRGTSGLNDAVYEYMISVFEKGISSVKVKTVTKDPNSYVINGNSARHLKIDIIISGQSMKSDIYIIRYKNVWYSISYLTMEPEGEKHASTATAIMKTFKTVAWE